MNDFIFVNLFRGVRRAALVQTSVKAVNATGGINQFLFSGKKRMTFGADFDAQIAARRASLKRITARASDGDFFIFRMYFRFHLFNGLLLFCKMRLSKANCNNKCQSDETSSQKVRHRSLE